jgi:hypothetical protein
LIISGKWSTIKLYDQFRMTEQYPEVIVAYGTSMNKIHAVNRDIDVVAPDFDILCNHSDDMWFIKKGFDDLIREHMEHDMFLHFPDQAAKELLCTYSIMDFTYYRRFKYVYHPHYKSLWADNEAQDVAKILGRYKFVNENILEHRHPINGFKEVMDEQYRKTESLYNTDKRTYLKRRAKRFDLQTRHINPNAGKQNGTA